MDYMAKIQTRNTNYFLEYAPYSKVPLVVSSYGPPYGYMSMQGMMSGDWMPYLPPADYNQGSAQEYSYVLQLNQPGTFWYVCTYPSHAEPGMYGRVILTS